MLKGQQGIDNEIATYLNVLGIDMTAAKENLKQWRNNQSNKTINDLNNQIKIWRTLKTTNIDVNTLWDNILMYLQNIQHPFFEDLAAFHPEVQKDDALEETEYEDHFSSVQPTITIDDIKPILSNEISPLGYEKLDGKYQKKRTNTKGLPPPPRPPEYHIETPGGKMYDFIEDKNKYKYTGGSNVILDENMDTLAHLILDLKKDVKN
ncbi:hypothetical protein GPJ56_005507 [Histomonas meleagridis]|nr:hypothetical protein GPJ56_005507 [Histomonas meleagridis]